MEESSAGKVFSQTVCQKSSLLSVPCKCQHSLRAIRMCTDEDMQPRDGVMEDGQQVPHIKIQLDVQEGLIDEKQSV